MCGIAGVFNIDLAPQEFQPALDLLSHRGPDGAGIERGTGFTLGHRRLAVIDPSGGKQPMKSDDGRYILIGNHEIYNFKTLRTELEQAGIPFHTRSDTEVLLKCFQFWGAASLTRFDGMFAFAIVDTTRGECFLARDYLGIKPLYYTRVGKGMAFASEVKALLALPNVAARVDARAKHLFLNLRFIPGEETLFEGIHKVPPGTLFRINRDGILSTERFRTIEQMIAPRRWSSENEIIDTIDETLASAVQAQLVSDRPVGLYLSGGIDSSLTAYYAQRAHPGIRSYCMKFGEVSDEDNDAQQVATQLGLQHTTLEMPQSPLNLLPTIIWHVEEPKVNCVQGFLLAQQVKRHVTVALCGLGGDELFTGYTNHDLLYPMSLLSTACSLSPPHGALGLVDNLRSCFGQPRFAHYFRMLDLLCTSFSPLPYYSILRNSFDHSPFAMAEIYREPNADFRYLTWETLQESFGEPCGDTFTDLLLLEMKTKLINDFLLTEDRVSMAHALEVRPPFLSNSVVSLALSIPASVRYRPFDKKRLLRALAQRHLGGQTARKRKHGFSFNPVSQFAKDLRRIAMSELTRDRAGDLGFNWRWIESVLNGPARASMRWHYFMLWMMTGFSIWHRLFVERSLQAEHQ
jgi:asparagine synthase (glutamine-hydrolysing)